MMTWVLSLLSSPLLNKIADILQKRADAQVAMRTSDNTTGAQIAADLLRANVETNKQKLLQQGWWGAKAIILIAGVPAAVHMGAIFLDSTFTFGWGIPKIPEPYDSYEERIVLSFFILQPVNGLIGVINAWVRR